jgi:Excalibur calcium-binding domain
MREPIKRAAAAVISAGAILSIATPFATAASSMIPYQWSNCSVVNQRYPHGVGRANAVDHTSGTPVTTFTHSTSLYNTAMRYHAGLDRDKDGIACEKA